MEKISGIIPASPRTKVVEISSAQPARPGAPAFGRPMGKNSLGDRITLSKLAEQAIEAGAGPALEAPITYKKPEVSKAKVIEDLNKKFFEKPTDIAKTEDGAPSEVALKRYQNVKGLADVPPARSETPDLQEN